MKQELEALSTQKQEIEKLLADTENKLELLWWCTLPYACGMFMTPTAYRCSVLLHEMATVEAGRADLMFGRFLHPKNNFWVCYLSEIWLEWFDSGAVVHSHEKFGCFQREYLCITTLVLGVVPHLESSQRGCLMGFFSFLLFETVGGGGRSFSCYFVLVIFLPPLPGEACVRWKHL